MHSGLLRGALSHVSVSGKLPQAGALFRSLIKKKIIIKTK